MDSYNRLFLENYFMATSSKRSSPSSTRSSPAHIFMGPYVFKVSHSPSGEISGYDAHVRTGRGLQPVSTVSREKAAVLANFARQLVRTGRYTKADVALVRNDAFRLLKQARSFRGKFKLGAAASQ